MRTKWLGVLLVVLSFVLSAALYSRLPDPVPSHWDAYGNVDGYTPKPLGAFLLPLTMAAVYALLVVLPRISPRGFAMDRFRGAFEIVQVTILAFLFLVNTVVLLAGIGVPVPIDRVLQAGTGLLFVVLGNYMGKFTRNFFAGIRTPWTLANEEVWLRTHRLAGKLFVAAGIVIFVSGLLRGGTAPLLAAAIVAGGVPAIYSYLLYRRLEGFKNEPPSR